MKPRVLLIDDDSKLRAMVADYLRENGMTVTEALDGERGLLELKRSAGSIEVVLLDIMMPGIDGLETLKRLRATHPALPVIMLTAKGDETDRIVGLELGADDYLAKPFGPRELLARIRAVLRRSKRIDTPGGLRVGLLVMNEEARTATWDEKEIALTGLEFDLLVTLAKRVGRVLSREQLLESVGRGDVNVGDRAIDVHVSHLRQKLLSAAGGGDLGLVIKTVRGVGYVLSKPRDDEDGT
ncbi:MAG: response regulator transcription factor [Polyangiaceae bacterium]|nr:response regulator transcription factor [Polyangiaceae bacterium]